MKLSLFALIAVALAACFFEMTSAVSSSTQSVAASQSATGSTVAATAAQTTAGAGFIEGSMFTLVAAVVVGLRMIFA